MSYREFFHQNLQMSRILVNKLNEQIAAYGLHHSQWMIVYYLKNFGSSTLVGIATYLNVEKSAVTRTVDRLEKSALIKRIPVTDKRERRIQLTELGEDVYTTCRQIVDKFEYDIMQGISEEEQASITKTLLKIRTNLMTFGETDHHE
ncbi:MAG TPA: MarR family transcriptional regulator [Desulfosporosinus sp.]|nr:MarR family transcriptional regulator [Desulfosporosinus sp.]